jgi:AcrR family transcriptional regulator
MVVTAVNKFAQRTIGARHGCLTLCVMSSWLPASEAGTGEAAVEDVVAVLEPAEAASDDSDQVIGVEGITGEMDPDDSAPAGTEAVHGVAGGLVGRALGQKRQVPRRSGPQRLVVRTGRAHQEIKAPMLPALRYAVAFTGLGHGAEFDGPDAVVGEALAQETCPLAVASTPAPQDPTAPHDSGLPLRERKKQRTRRALADAALDLFSERGFDRVTLEELTAHAEIGRSTFFRYYGTKEGVAMAAEGDLWDAYVDRFARHDAPGRALEALRTSLTEAILSMPDDWDHRFLRTRRLAAGTPVLRDHSILSSMKAQQRLVELLEERLGIDSRDDVRLRLLGEFALSAWRCGARNWVAGRTPAGDKQRGHGGTKALAHRVAEAFDAIPAALAFDLPDHRPAP